MSRVRYTTTIEEKLLIKARIEASSFKMKRTNDIIEAALECYFSKEKNEIWEKSLESGWIERIIITKSKIGFENIREKKEINNTESENFSQDKLQSNGWIKIK